MNFVFNLKPLYIIQGTLFNSKYYPCTPHYVLGTLYMCERYKVSVMIRIREQKHNTKT